MCGVGFGLCSQLLLEALLKSRLNTEGDLSNLSSCWPQWCEIVLPAGILCSCEARKKMYPAVYNMKTFPSEVCALFGLDQFSMRSWGNVIISGVYYITQ